MQVTQPTCLHGCGRPGQPGAGPRGLCPAPAFANCTRDSFAARPLRSGGFRPAFLCEARVLRGQWFAPWAPGAAAAVELGSQRRREEGAGTCAPSGHGTLDLSVSIQGL